MINKEFFFGQRDTDFREKTRLDSNIDSKSLNNTYLNIIEILFLF